MSGAGASRDGSAHQSQAWELVTWAPSSSGPTSLGWRVYFLVSVSCSLNVVLSVLLLPAWAGMGLENKRPPSVSDGVQCSQPPTPSPEPLHHGGHTGMGSGARCLSEMGFEGAGGLGGVVKRKRWSVCSAREPGGGGAPLTEAPGTVFCGARTKAHARHFTRSAS